MIDMKIHGADELGIALKKIGAKLRSDIALEALMTVATPISNGAKRHARRGKGGLQNSIGIRAKKKKRNAGWSLRVGPRWGFKSASGEQSAIVGPIQEYGRKTKDGKVEAAPFMRPAWQQNKGGAFATAGNVVNARLKSFAASVKSKPRGK